jgi:hypothetical protein
MAKVVRSRSVVIMERLERRALESEARAAKDRAAYEVARRAWVNEAAAERAQQDAQPRCDSIEKQRMRLYEAFSEK